MRQKVSGFDILLFILLSGVVLVTLYPFVYMIAVSLSDNVHVLKGEVFLWPKGLNLDVYRIVLQDPLILRSYLNTIIYVLLGTAISLLVTSAGAFAISKTDLLFYRGFMIMIVVTMFFSGGMIPTFLVVKSYGLVDTIWGMVLPTAVSTWNLIVMRTFFAGLPKEVEESGKMDGLTDVGVFFRLALPLSKAILATIGLFYAVAIWNNFFSAMLYLRSSDLFPLQVVLRNIVLQGVSSSSQATNIGGDTMLVDESLKFATIIVSTLPILMVYPFLQKYFAKGALIGSIKG
ncbi:putative aldouronate transport system permease protein [Paenibacillus sp. UNCCL117]|uniref:carbohydrate ABC transporter permease n=1 Tax=unclassified Paenibacillus TaxID=185978 RepID=UPI0008910321|nr:MULTISPECIES: carbohydrate ABC transporter permease [unclassified Paenibacillus]SDC63736.1 putative aldouronate transport system permease protein [Paenibacillus sp. cl123]SFW22366.1 putative aldouronate transport system permease protein [Paenibacillus sp. UNCCL117]